MRFFLTGFTPIRPLYESTQTDGCKWILAAHTKAESVLKKESFDRERFAKTLQHLIDKVACKPTAIAKRGHVIPDFLHTEWEKMEVYPLDSYPQGLPIKERMVHYSRIVEPLFDQFYEFEQLPPDYLLHVSCTGYTAPSAAQKLVSQKKWGAETVVTSVYHMGCYAALPAIRMAMGYLACVGEKADIVHTEVSTLHVNPLLHGADQLIGQSLFADGFIKYSLCKESGNIPALAIEGLHEEIIPNSLAHMKWDITEWNFHLVLAKEIPTCIREALDNHFKTLCAKTKIDFSYLQKNAIFAIHPGGPRILEQIKEIFGLEEEQLVHSRRILREYGNMSSGTLPHIWDAILKDDTIKAGTKIVGFVFGPGLYVGSLILEKA